MALAVCPGSFDPVTLGHLHVVRRARAMFDDVIVAVASNPGKSGLLGAEQRLDLVRGALAADPATRDVRARLVTGLIADFCLEQGATAIVKGLRGGGDFDAELPMALMNRHLGVETVFVVADQASTHIASSLVKDIAGHGGPIDDLVPVGVAAAVRAALAARGTHE